jgi:hypothetical protein
MDLVTIFSEEYRRLRPRAEMPVWRVEFYRFTHINNTIRLREGRIAARLSDLLEGAPEAVLRALAHILLAKLYRKPVDRQEAQRYRRYITSQSLSSRAEQVRSLRGHKQIDSAQGRVYDLDAIFDELNRRFFWGLLARPQMTWSRERSRAALGHYDPAHNAIVVSRVFDSPRAPQFAVEYIVFHEMLHLKHPVTVRGGRRTVHGKEFQADERQFPQFEEAKAFLRTL